MKSSTKSTNILLLFIIFINLKAGIDLIGFFSNIEQKEADESKNVARNRLKLVLMQDRTNLNPYLLERMRGELIDLLSKYVEMDKEALDLNFENDGESVALMLSIPVIRAKEEEEIEAALKAEDEAKKEIEEKLKALEEQEESEDDDESDDEDDEESEDSDETDEEDVEDAEEETSEENENSEGESTETEEKPKKKKHKKKKKKALLNIPDVIEVNEVSEEVVEVEVEEPTEDENKEETQEEKSEEE